MNILNILLAEPSATDTDSGSPMIQSLFDDIRTSLEQLPIGGTFETDNFDEVLDTEAKIMEANNDTINETDYNAGHTTDWDDDIITTELEDEELTEQYNNVVYLKDIKSNNTDAGAFVKNAWRTRDLTDIENEQAWCSLAANQFTLLAGTYEIEANAPAVNSEIHKAKLRNITDGSDEIIGTQEDMSNLVSQSIVNGIFTITDTKVFELQHYCSFTSLAYPDGGFGIASNFSVDEVYSIVKIKRIKTRIMKICEGS